jgi:hypothetical protein
MTSTTTAVMESHGAPWFQPVATGRTFESQQNGKDKPKPLLSVATDCRKQRMVGMRSRLASALPCPAGRSVPGRGGPERRRRPRPDGTGARGYTVGTRGADPEEVGVALVGVPHRCRPRMPVVVGGGQGQVPVGIDDLAHAGGEIILVA